MGGGAKEYDSGYRDRSRESDRQRNYRSYSNVRRSSDYRTEESTYSKSDDYEYAERRQYRSQNEYRKDYHRDRERRSRSRSRSCEVDSYPAAPPYDSSKNHCDRSEADRERHKEKKEEVPNNTLMIRNLPLHFTDKDVSLEINNKYGLYPKDVRLMKNKETGQSRGFAFIEFPSVEQAVQLKEMTQGCMLIENEHECSLHFSFPKEAPVVDKNGIKNDWSCPKCGINNFKRRDECFKCGTSKDDPRTFDKSEVIQHHPTNVLQLRNLSVNTTEERVLTIIGTLTSMPIKSIRIAQQDSTPRRSMCTLELHSVFEATQLFHAISSMTNGFVIDDANVSLSYGPRIDNSSVAATSFASHNAAMAALAAAQWKNLDDSSKSKAAQGKSATLGSVTVNGVEYTKYNTPDYASFQYDATSGYYYDPSTGFYYDSNSQYFYNSQTQKYMYFDAANQIYVSVDSTGQAMAGNSTAPNNSSTPKSTEVQVTKKAADDNISKQQDKVKIAKKIAKDMEKWAKMLNQKKESAKPLAQAEMVPVESMERSSLDITVSEKQPTNFELPAATTIAPATASAFAAAVPAATITTNTANTTTSSTSADPFEIIRAEEEKLTDWKRLACLLCKRQFTSGELLTKHQQLSELHMTNLAILRESLLNQEQLEHVENMERDLGYRDRAKERRDKFGIDDTPEYPKQKVEEKEPIESASAPALPIATDNIGNRMLKAMGWTEGSGLGKSNQGISDIIQVERRRGGLGLGSSNATFTRESYKEAVRRTALQRFKELSES